MHFIILDSGFEDEHLQVWQNACAERPEQLSCEVVDLSRHDWLDIIRQKKFDGLLTLPPNLSDSSKSMYDERVRILAEVCGYQIYPTLPEIMIYENKKYLSYWLMANRISHPKTWVFYKQEAALESMQTLAFPIVAKTNIGASGHGVYILRSKSQAVSYIRRAFSSKGAKRKTGPNWQKKGFLKRVIKKLRNYSEVKAKLAQYQEQRQDVQRSYAIFQEFIPHDFEWRCVRIGDSFFAHKKMVKEEKASGSLLKGYENPPLALLDFIREITDKHQLWSQSIDIFETRDGRYLVNEMQCTFGQSDPYQMLVDGTPGRYIYQNDQWVFETGDFNRHESFLLRVDHFMKILNFREVTA